MQRLTNNVGLGDSVQCSNCGRVPSQHPKSPKLGFFCSTSNTDPDLPKPKWIPVQEVMNPLQTDKLDPVIIASVITFVILILGLMIAVVAVTF